MALIDITPIMTSNTTPSPYVVTASSSYNGSGYSPYRIFENSNNISTSAWVTLSGNNSGWLKLDFGTSTKINAISLKSRTNSDASSSATWIGTEEMPKNFKLYGSNDDVQYTELLSVENEILWTVLEGRLYKLITEVNYRYYKLVVSSNNGYSKYLAIGEMHFYQEDSEVTPTTSYRKASLIAGLPHGTKLRLDNLTDERLYMLATEDDGENEGTLRMVNHAGKFIYPKAGIGGKTIFKGSAISGGEYTFSESIENFKSLIFITDYYQGSWIYENFILVKDIEYTSSEMKYIIFNPIGTAMISNQKNISFVNERTFKIYDTNTYMKIIEVYGIY